MEEKGKTINSGTIKNKKKIVIHGCTGLKNSGDEAILQTIVEQYGREYEITAISKHVAYTKKMHPDIHVIPDEKALCRAAIAECDLFLMGGGGLLQDETTIFNVAVWLRYLKYALKLKKKVCLYGNSIGPLNYKANHYLVKEYLKHVDLITLRDEDSAKLLQEIGAYRKGRVFVTADPVFSMKWEKKQEKEAAAEEEPYVCMALRHWYDMVPLIPAKICSKYHIRMPGDKKRYEDYIRTMAACTEYVNRELGWKVVFLSFYYGRDEKVAKDIMAAVTPTPGIQNTLVSEEYLRPEQMLGILSHARLLISMRLHSMIYAIKAGVPVVILDYSSKVKGMAELNGLEEYSVSMKELSVEKLKKKIRKVLKEEKEIKEKLHHQQECMEEREKKNKMLLRHLMKDQEA